MIRLLDSKPLDAVVAGPAIRMVLAIVVVAASIPAAQCKSPKRDRTDRLGELVAHKRWDEALTETGSLLAGPSASARGRMLEVALLARTGKTPEALDSYLRRIGAGDDPDPVLLEAVVLSSMPEPMRVDPGVFDASADSTGSAPGHEGGGTRPIYGQGTMAAIRLVLQGKDGAQVPKLRLVYLVSMLAVPGRDETLPSLDELVDQMKEPLVRHSALLAITAIGTPGAARSLAGISGRFAQSLLMQRQVLEAIAVMPRGGEDAVAALLASKSETLRARAAGILMQRAGAEAADGRTLALLEGSSGIEAQVALLALGKAPAGTQALIEQYMRSLHSALEQARFLTLLGETASDATVPLLCEQTRNADLGVATTAIQMLQRAKLASSGPCLVEVAGSTDEKVARAGLRALIDVPAGESTGALCTLVDKLMKDGDVAATTLGAGALGRAGGEEAEAVLRRLLASDEKRQRRAAAVALWYLGDDVVVPVVEETVADLEGPWDLQDFYEWRLVAQAPTGRTLPIVERAIGEGNPNLRDKLVDGLTDGAAPEAIFLVETVQLRRMGEGSLEIRSPSEGKIPQLAREAVARLERDGHESEIST